MASVSAKELKIPFKICSECSLAEVRELIRHYKKEDLPFGIDTKDMNKLISSIKSDFQATIAHEIVTEMSKNATNGIINGLALLAGMVVFSSSTDENPTNAKFDAIFDIFDFNDIGEISIDEVGILLMSLLYAMHVMTGIGKDPHEVEVEDITNDLSGLLGKSEDDAISKREFRRWMKQQVGETAMTASSLLSSFGFSESQTQHNEQMPHQNAIRGKQLPPSQSFQHSTEKASGDSKRPSTSVSNGKSKALPPSMGTQNVVEPAKQKEAPEFDSEPELDDISEQYSEELSVSQASIKKDAKSKMQPHKMMDIGESTKTS